MRQFRVSFCTRKESVFRERKSVSIAKRQIEKEIQIKQYKWNGDKFCVLVKQLSRIKQKGSSIKGTSCVDKKASRKTSEIPAHSKL